MRTVIFAKQKRFGVTQRRKEYTKYTLFEQV
jgi:hypothetical protein